MSALVRQFARQTNVLPRLVVAPSIPRRFCAAASKPKVPEAQGQSTQEKAQQPPVDSNAPEKVVETETTTIDPTDGGIKLDATEIVDIKPKRRLRRRREATFGEDGSMAGSGVSPESELTPEEEAIAEKALMERLQAKAEKCCKQIDAENRPKSLTGYFFHWREKQSYILPEYVIGATILGVGGGLAAGRYRKNIVAAITGKSSVTTNVEADAPQIQQTASTEA